MSGLIRRIITAALSKDEQAKRPGAALALRPNPELASQPEQGWEYADTRPMPQHYAETRPTQLHYAPYPEPPGPPPRARKRVVVIEEIYYRED